MQDFQIIESILTRYFKGLHHADIATLGSICSPQLVLQSPNLRRPLDEWLERVASRPVPAGLGHEEHYQILSLDVAGDQAMAKLYCPLLGHQYIDFIGLLKEQGEWQIVSKMYCELSSTHLKKEIKHAVCKHQNNR